MIQPSRILVLAPHTDDGELGCGGSIARFCREKREVHYVAFSTCKKSLPSGSSPDTLEKECKLAVKELGMDQGKLLFFDFEVREFDTKRQEILEELVSLNKSIQPDLVIIPSANDIHQDHQVMHNEALRAFNKSSLLGYELPWGQSQFTTQLFGRTGAQPLYVKNSNQRVLRITCARAQAWLSIHTSQARRSNGYWTRLRVPEKKPQPVNSHSVQLIVG